MTDVTPADLSTLDGRIASARISLSEDGSSYTAERVFGAPPARVYRAFTDPQDLRVWFPAGAPEGSKMTTCESDPIAGGTYRYEMTIPGFGEIAWHGTYTRVDPPNGLDAEEWFVMGGGGPDGPPTTQTLTFDALEGGMTKMTMAVRMPDPQDPDEFMEQSAAGLTTSLTAMDRLISA
ncbi:MAG: hypothetical protein EA388_00175 [Nitriliruptor sp.]|nr:MAG: hypothetical protein EA388_00175 [Nitriliruptor sp.]